MITKKNGNNEKVLKPGMMRVSFFLILTIIISTFSMPAMEVNAAQKPQLNINPEHTAYLDSNSLNSYYSIGTITNLSKNAKVTFKSSNKKVVANKDITLGLDVQNVQNGQDDQNDYVWIKARKPGKTTITCTVKQGNKKYTAKCKFTFVKYKNPVASLKIGNKNYASLFDDVMMAYAPKSNKSQKVTVKANKGYKIENISVYKDGKIVNIKNGSKFKFKKSYMLYVTYSNKQGLWGTLGLLAN